MQFLPLRGGYSTTDPRLDFLPEKDERSREYPAVRLLGSAQQTPISKVWDLSARLDQGQEGQCVMYSLSHELAAEPVPVELPNNEIMLKKWITKRYHQAQREDQWPGGGYEGADPNYEGTSLLGGVKVLHALGLFQEYRWAFGEEDLFVSLGHLGPACIGVNWYAGMGQPDSNGLLNVSGQHIGGHAIIVRGVDVENGIYRLTNSWGRSYGVDGECFMTRQDMARLLGEEGECLIPVGRETPVVDWTI